MREPSGNLTKWIAGVFAVTAALLVFAPSPKAIPAFARKYNVKCFTCHTTFPRLNKTGYLFKRLGYRMPPDLEEGKPAPKISEIDKKYKWSLTNSAALVIQTSFTQEKTTGGGPSTSASSFNLDHALLFLGGTVPDSNFSYLTEFKLYEDGEHGLETAYVQYTGGDVQHSWFGRLGKMHLQETEGFRGSDPMGLFDEGPLMFTSADPNGFTFDQAPVGMEVGYTWASMYYKHVVGLSLKVTNGLDADGSEITQNSTKNSKDVWFQADYLFGPDGGISVTAFQGRKFQVQNAGTPDEFQFEPRAHRVGLYGNYLFFDKLDLLGGYMWGKDDWQWGANQPMVNYQLHSWYGEVDYYIAEGFVAMGRYDNQRERLDGDVGSTYTRAWSVGIQKTLTKQGNLRARLAYTDQRSTDPTNAIGTDKLLKFDVRLGW